MNRTWAPFEGASGTEAAPTLDSLTTDGRYRKAQPHVTSSKQRDTSATGIKPDQIKSATLSFRDMHEYGELLVKYLETRKSIFLNGLGWRVAEADGMEFDQYDTPFARWIVLHQFGEILGSVRMLPTTANCGMYSYMLRDAQRGVLEDLPTDVLFFPAPVEHNVWEATRFFITDAVPAARRQDVQMRLFRAMSHTAMENGATHVIGIVPAVWSRWARRIGVNATPIGVKFAVDGTVSQSVLFKARDFVL